MLTACFICLQIAFLYTLWGQVQDIALPFIRVTIYTDPDEPLIATTLSSPETVEGLMSLSPSFKLDTLLILITRNGIFTSPAILIQFGPNHRSGGKTSTSEYLFSRHLDFDSSAISWCFVVIVTTLPTDGLANCSMPYYNIDRVKSQQSFFVAVLITSLKS